MCSYYSYRHYIMHMNDDYNLQNNVFIIAPLFSWMSHAYMCELHNNYKGTPYRLILMALYTCKVKCETSHLVAIDSCYVILRD